MTILAAVNWIKNEENNSIDFMLIDGDTLEVIHSPTRYQNINNEHDIDEYLKIINSEMQKNIKRDSIELHYKTVMGAPPKHYRGGHRNTGELSAYAHDKVRELAEKYSPDKENKDLQLKSTLYNKKGKRVPNNLIILTSSLDELGYSSKKPGESYIRDLWMIALHIRPSELKKKVKQLWRAKQRFNNSGWTKQQRKEFEQFYNNLINHK